MISLVCAPSSKTRQTARGHTLWNCFPVVTEIKVCVSLPEPYHWHTKSLFTMYWLTTKFIIFFQVPTTISGIEHVFTNKIVSFEIVSWILQVKWLFTIYILISKLHITMYWKIKTQSPEYMFLFTIKKYTNVSRHQAIHLECRQLGAI